MNNFSAISWREQVIFDEMMKYVRFVLNQHAWFDFASSLKQQSAARHVAPLETQYPDCKQTSLCPHTLMLHA
jgi:hypothetical protein